MEVIQSNDISTNTPVPSPACALFMSVGNLHVVWMDKEVAPCDVLKIVCCKCQSGCKGKPCSCNSTPLYAQMFVPASRPQTLWMCTQP